MLKWHRAASTGPSRSGCPPTRRSTSAKTAAHRVNRDYDVPFRFTGELHKLVVELKPAAAPAGQNPPGRREDRHSGIQTPASSDFRVHA